jgi:hypothetical protein
MADNSGALGAHFRPQRKSSSKIMQLIKGVGSLPLSAANEVMEAAGSVKEGVLDITGELGAAYRRQAKAAAAKAAAAKEAAKEAAAAAKEAAAAKAAAEQYFEYKPSEREKVMSRTRIREAKEREAAAMSKIIGGGSNKKPVKKLVKKPLKKLVKKPVVKPAKKKVATTRARK